MSTTPSFGKNELAPHMADLQKRGALAKFIIGAATGSLMMHGAAQAAELGKIDPREAAAYAQFVDTMRTQPMAAAPPATFVLEPGAPSKPGIKAKGITLARTNGAPSGGPG